MFNFTSIIFKAGEPKLLINLINIKSLFHGSTAKQLLRESFGVDI
jgi:hypothetical protein